MEIKWSVDWRPLGQLDRYLIKMQPDYAKDIMGAHGINPFDEDHAADWLADLCEQDDPKEFFHECLDLEDIDYLEMMECAAVLGTCVMIDGVLNGPSKNLPEEAVEWIAQNQKFAVKRFLPKAVAGLDAVLSEDSEMNELWKENAKLYPQWRKLVVEIQDRLRGAIA